MTFPWEEEFTKRSNQIGAVIFVCVHGFGFCEMVYHQMRRYITASQLFKRKLTDVEVADSLVLFYAQIAENEHIDKIFLQLRKKISFFICIFAPDLTKIHCRLRSAKISNEFGSLLSLARQFA